MFWEFQAAGVWGRGPRWVLTDVDAYQQQPTRDQWPIIDPEGNKRRGFTWWDVKVRPAAAVSLDRRVVPRSVRRIGHSSASFPPESSDMKRMFKHASRQRRQHRKCTDTDFQINVQHPCVWIHLSHIYNLQLGKKKKKKKTSQRATVKTEL